MKFSVQHLRMDAMSSAASATLRRTDGGKVTTVSIHFPFISDPSVAQETNAQAARSAAKQILQDALAAL